MLWLCVVVVVGRHHKGHHGDEVARWVRDASTRRRQDDIQSALAVVGDALREIEAYYRYDLAILKHAVVDPSNTDPNLRHRFGPIVFGKRKFVISVIGGPTAAGEGVWRSASWPAVLEARLEPVFARLDVALELRNMAAPRRPEFPDNLCLGPIVGNDADVVISEWRSTWDDFGFGDIAGWPAHEDLVWNRNATLFSSKKPRPPRLVRRRELAAFETFLRTALAVESRPALHFVALDPDGGDNASTFRHALDKGGILHDAYRKYDVNFFSAFGAPFNHLRKRFRNKKTNRARRQNCTDLSRCAVHALQDGHHARPLRLGFKTDDRPPSWAAIHARPRDLFVDGRLGALGHEVVANQLAYHYLRVLNASLVSRRDLFSNTAAAAAALEQQQLQRKSSVPHAPPPVACGGLFCPRDNQPRCAYSSLPKAGPLDVGDIIANSTGVTRWRNVAVDDFSAAAAAAAAAASPRSSPAWRRCDADDPSRPGLAACHNAEDSCECYEYHAACSHHGTVQARAFEGDSGAGPLELDVDFPRRSRCAVMIAEPILRSDKPLTLANWFHELKVVVEGILCLEPACRVLQTKQTGGTQVLFVDLAKLDQCAECKTCWTLQPVHIDLHVVPLAQIATNVCGQTTSGKCVPVGTWKHYDLGCTRQPPTPDDSSSAGCWRPLMHNVLTGETTDVRNPQLVSLAVSTVIIF
ncbi:hypothetical protein CTAYLR_004967 [Chrysophaeum taylorii]|uniref:Uncharacterized protein n=1 Tax=Chrysophaeum taylorii TaxID=2483200 RepID=A0AAD7UPG3_9STRA|nr:hypothetical protein CTAYLR_004967 [Chrysophaeum taylorii]